MTKMKKVASTWKCKIVRKSGVQLANAKRKDSSWEFAQLSQLWTIRFGIHDSSKK